MKQRLTSLACGAVLALAIAALVLTGVPPHQAGADVAGQRLLELPLNTNSLRVRPAASTLSAPRIVWEHYAIKTFADASTTTQEYEIEGLLETDCVTVTANTEPTNASYISSAVPTADTLTIWYNTDPGAAIDFTVHVVRLED